MNSCNFTGTISRIIPFSKGVKLVLSTMDKYPVTIWVTCWGQIGDMTPGDIAEVYGAKYRVSKVGEKYYSEFHVDASTVKNARVESKTDVEGAPF